MEQDKNLSLSFFEKIRPTISKDTHNEIETIKWSKEVLNGEKQILVTIPKEK